MITFLLLLTLLFPQQINTGYESPAGDVKVVTLKGLQEIIKNRKGKILVLNVWATWCIPCKEEMPDLMELQKKRKDIEVIGLSIDYDDEVESKIKPFIKREKITFKILVNGEKSDEKLINFLGSSWNGAIPATFIYDTKGKQVLALEGKKSYAQFADALANLK